MNTELTKPIGDANVRGWIFYDAACALCVRGRQRTGRLFESRGFEWLPLQTPGAAARLGVTESAFDIRMHVLTADGRVLHNADALGLLCRSVWWLWPFGILLLTPGFRELARLAYDWFARNRYCIGGACETDPVKPEQYLGWLRWPVAAAFPILALLGAWKLPAWQLMCAIWFALFAAAKWITLVPSPFRKAKPSVGKIFAYLFVWPGLDPITFCLGRNVIRSKAREWFWAAIKTLFGVGMIWLALRIFHSSHPLIVGWTAMVGMIFILHFGGIHLLSVACRTAGVNAKPLMRSPIRATSLSSFWNERWNSAFTDLMRPHYFALAKRFGTSGAMFAVFLVSGLVHDLVISVPARGGYGLPTTYFMIQSLGIAFERSATGQRLGLGNGFRGWLFMFVITAGPAFWLFHPPFVRNVILPMLHAIGAK